MIPQQTGLHNYLGKKISLNSRLLATIVNFYGVPHLGTNIRLNLTNKLLQSTGLPNSAKILDAGCGFGLVTQIISQKYKNVTGVDINPEKIESAKLLCSLNKRDINFHEEDLTNSNLPGEKFDLIVCFEVLEHIKQDKKAIGEIARLLKKNGELVASFPDENPFGYEMTEMGHVRNGYSVEEFSKLSKKSGLRLEKSLSYGQTTLGRKILDFDYGLAKISPYLQAFFSPLLFPMMILDQYFPRDGKEYCHIVLLSKINAESQKQTRKKS